MFLDRSQNQATNERTGRRAPSLPAAAPLSSLQALHAAAGNAAATQAVQRARGIRPNTVGNAELTRAVQRALHEHGPGCAHDRIDVQRRVEGEPAVQRRSAFFAAQQTPGRALASQVQRTAEQAYGMRFGHVRVHDDPVSQQSAVEMGASAYTSGSDIFIGPQGVDDETMYHELDHVWQQALGPVAGTDNGMGAKVSSPRDAFEVSSAANGRRVARGEAPDLTLPDAHGHGTHVQRTAVAPAVQRMENPRGRRDERGYDADASGPEQDSDSSPERRELEEWIRREVGERRDLDDLMEQVGRLEEAPAMSRVRRLIAESDSDSPESAPEPSARIRLPALEPMPTLAEHTDLAPLRELLMRDLQRRDLGKKLKVTFNVFATGNVLEGHAWMEVTGSTGQRVSFGFFPARGVQFGGLGSVPGGVQCPDPFVGRRDPTFHESKNVALRDVVKGYEMVHARTQSDYNFTLHNCTTFASDVWKAMTGEPLPTNYLSPLGLLSGAVSTPKATADGLKRRQEQRTNDRRERVLPHAQGPVRGLMPGAGTAEEVAERFARERQSQSSSSESTEEVD